MSNLKWHPLTTVAFDSNCSFPKIINFVTILTRSGLIVYIWNTIFEVSKPMQNFNFAFEDWGVNKLGAQKSNYSLVWDFATRLPRGGLTGQNGAKKAGKFEIANSICWEQPGGENKQFLPHLWINRFLSILLILFCKFRGFCLRNRRPKPWA